MSLTKEQITNAVNLIEAICQDPNSEPFLEPVAWKDLELIDYPQIVKNPMDLGTVKNRLVTGNIATYEELFAEI